MCIVKAECVQEIPTHASGCRLSRLTHCFPAAYTFKLARIIIEKRKKCINKQSKPFDIRLSDY